MRACCTLHGDRARSIDGDTCMKSHATMIAHPPTHTYTLRRQNRLGIVMFLRTPYALIRWTTSSFSTGPACPDCIPSPAIDRLQQPSGLLLQARYEV